VRPAAILALVLPLAAACGDNLDGFDLLGELAALPGVEVVEVTPGEPNEGLRYFDLWFDQPIDHGAAGGPVFRTYGALIHVDADAPLVVYTSGYGAGRLRSRGEVATLVGGNQLSLEYRYYRDSIPTPPDWSKLDVAQASADIHHVVELVKPLYPGAWLNTGGSKGGETTLHSRYFYPDDFAGSVAYVTPVRLGNPDLRYSGILDRIGDPDCRIRLRAAQRELAVRRAAMIARAEAGGDDYAVLGVDYAVETAIVEVEWAFWQYRGFEDCDEVPAPTADDATLGQFLDDTSPPAAYADVELAANYGAFAYQAMTELGYPLIDHPHLEDLTVYDYQDLRPFLPAGVDGDALVFDPTFDQALLDWAATTADRVLIVDGEWDPWSGGAVTLAPDRDARRYVAPRASHGASIADLTDVDRSDAMSRLARWTGVSVRAGARAHRDGIATSRGSLT
jgi:hypothetical protein